MPEIKRFTRGIAQERFLAYLKARKRNASPLQIKVALNRITKFRRELFPDVEVFEKRGKSRMPIKIISKKIPVSDPNKLAAKIVRLLEFSVALREHHLRTLREKYGITITETRKKGEVIYEIKLPENVTKTGLAIATTKAERMLADYRWVLRAVRDRLVALETTYELLDAPKDVKERLAKELGPNFVKKLEKYSADAAYRNNLKSLLKSIKNYWDLYERDPEGYKLVVVVMGLHRALDSWSSGNNLSLH